jgi:NitT/TauT family transport system substrate-binding protein
LIHRVLIAGNKRAGRAKRFARHGKLWDRQKAGSSSMERSMGHNVKMLKSFVAAGLCAVLMASGAPGAADAQEKLTVRFTWKLKGEYAPLFVALDKGYYKAEGLDVQLSEGNGAQNVLKALAAGNENFGYGPGVAAAQAVTRDLPVKVAALYQTRAPMGVIAFPDTQLKGPKDLEGKRIAISVGETFGDMIRPFTRLNKVDIDKIQMIQMDSSARTMQFLTRKIDVMSVYLSNELPQLEKRAGVRFNTINVSDYGLNVLGASMYVSNAFAEKNPEAVKKLLRATEKGYRDAMANPKEAAKIMGKYMAVPEASDILERQVEATMSSTNAPAGKPVGWQSDADWQNTLNLLKETGLIKEAKPLNAYFTNQFLQ